MASEWRAAPPENHPAEGEPLMNSFQATQTQWTKYDEFAGPTLDSGLWEPLSFGPVIALEPEARTTVENGVLTVDIPKFTNCDPSNQGPDNSKHVVLSKQGLRLDKTTCFELSGPWLLGSQFV